MRGSHHLKMLIISHTHTHNLPAKGDRFHKVDFKKGLSFGRKTERLCLLFANQLWIRLDLISAVEKQPG